jgi:hypothetical protein
MNPEFPKEHRPDPSESRPFPGETDKIGGWLWYALSLLGVVAYTWLGWGHWGFCAFGDYCLDLTDALRVFQGDTPYRDFIPTYGALHMLLVAPLFHLGRGFFPVLWILTGILIFLQVAVILRAGRSFLSPLGLFVLMVFAISAMAFGPINSKFILGYSSSGFLGSLMSTGAILCLWRGPGSVGRCLAAGMFLGLELFTKIDLGFTALVLVVVWSGLWIRKAPSSAWSLLAGFVFTWLGFCVLLLLNGGTVAFVVESTLDALGQVNSFRDENLTVRIRCLGVLAFLVVILLLLRVPRRFLRRAERRLRPFGWFLLPVVVGWDLFRTEYHVNILKRLVMLNWFWMLIWFLMVSRLAAAILRTRSLRPLRLPGFPILPVLLVVSGMGFMRVMGSGWYPINYFQPAIVILSVFWLARQHVHILPKLRPGLHAVVVVALLLQFATSMMACVRSTDWIRTPFGDFASTLPPHLNTSIRQMASRVEREAGAGSLLCTYEPSAYILTGKRIFGLYTFFQKLAYTGPRQPMRESQCLRQFEEHPPQYIIQGHEMGPVHQRFGIDYGKQIRAFIQEHYEVTGEESGNIYYRLKSRP